MISEKTQRTKTIHQPPFSFSLIPDEITENILARVSRWNYPSLSLVSKRFRSLVSSMQIYKTRSQIGSQETCFYVYLELRNNPYRSWFSLWTKPNQTPTKLRWKNWYKKDSSGKFSVVPLPFSSSHSPHITNSTKIIGSEIYIIGGPFEEPSSSVRILDCRSHTWRDGPNMTLARENAGALFSDNKIYVMGGCHIDEDFANWIEVFDMKTQSWTALPGPGADEDELRSLLHECYYIDIVDVRDGKLYLAIDEKEYAYDPKDGTWKLVRDQPNFLLDTLVVAYEIENVMYGCMSSGVLKWFDSKTDGGEWREIKGLEKLRGHCTNGLRTGRAFDITEDGRKLLVMWKLSGDKGKNKIWYARISLESRCNGREVWGNVECVDVLTFPGESFDTFFCLTASV
ncbi:unnamed protein product [Microthlaspi erraticum]|uniref:F-box domain-containing protein n=1 Tax=Microthlaspi erraticum TaxID=1685480 RepID=A0A6D2IVV5_9BRAS|nr:unnamed protein product [Microthlaspi erraticum]